MKYLSVCSGIEAATVAWHHMGWQPVAFSEIEPFPSAVLAHHYPNVPNVGDMTKFQEWKNDPIDLLVGGTPCQSFSVAGLRKGLADPRGNLMLTFLAIAERQRPKWVVWENVPGVLSSGGGRDFGTFLSALGELGYGWAYRVLDAQWFGVAQRRRRVFVVGCLGDQRSAAAVLFERESVCRNPAPSREKRENIAKCLTTGIAQRFDSETETMIPVALAENTIGRQPLNGGNGVGFTVGGPMYTLNATGVHGVARPITFGAQMSVPQNDVDMVQTLQAKNPMAVAQPVAVAFDTYNQTVTGDTTQTLCSRGDSPGGNAHLVPAVAQPVQYVGGVDCQNNGHEMHEPAGPLLKGSPTGGGQPLPAIATAMQVRRLTPVECERLQGFPDGYTNIPWRKSDESPDGPRYKALGNSMAVPVMRWIGERINSLG